MVKKQLLLALGFLGLAVGQDCAVSIVDRIDCGYYGIKEPECVSLGCCWGPVRSSHETKDIPWCFFEAGVTRPPSVCDDIIWSANDPGFDQAIYDIMYDNYKANLNVENCGAVVAAPDQSTPGGSYYYHWMRDAGLSIKAWLDINNNDLSIVKEKVDPYIQWVSKVQHKPDPNVDVRVEPKFEIPSGDPYTGGWCRPQTDGPALRAMAVSKYGMILNQAGQDASQAWGLVQFDLLWVIDNWRSEGCDLWEEVRSQDFYFNRMAYVYSLNEAAKFAEALGKPEASTYRDLASEIATATRAHYKDGFIYESTNRPVDGAVIHSISTFGEYMYGPESSEAADTISVIARSFCEEYPINQQDVAAGEAGLLIGRYPGDSYGGGNPWQLLTAVFGELFYLGGQATLKDIKARGDNYVLDYNQSKSWMDLLKLAPGSTAADLATRQFQAGDAVMNRLYQYVKNDGGRVDEQIDKRTGAQTSAAGLTWSYANILHSLWVRENTAPLLEEVTGRPVHRIFKQA